MPIDSLEQLEARIRETHGLNAQQKDELLRLLADLKQEIADLSETHAEHVHSIARFTDISAHEATRQHKNQDLLRMAMEGLSTSVAEVEASHPTVVDTVNRISSLLSNIGI
jgi:methyl-accepting chemotaxis protein